MILILTSVLISHRPLLAASCTDSVSVARFAQLLLSSHGSELSKPAEPSPDSSRRASSFSHTTMLIAKQLLFASSSSLRSGQWWLSSEHTG